MRTENLKLLKPPDNTPRSLTSGKLSMCFIVRLWILIGVGKHEFIWGWEGVILYPRSRKQTKLVVTQPAITCSKLTIETVEQGVKYVQSSQ